jgi:hypothetical protein
MSNVKWMPDQNGFKKRHKKSQHIKYDVIHALKFNCCTEMIFEGDSFNGTISNTPQPPFPRINWYKGICINSFIGVITVCLVTAFSLWNLGLNPRICAQYSDRVLVFGKWYNYFHNYYIAFNVWHIIYYPKILLYPKNCAIRCGNISITEMKILIYIGRNIFIVNHSVLNDILWEINEKINIIIHIYQHL